jgi:predicted nucleic-acid-binding protein
MKFLDTNFFIRFLTKDWPEKAQKCKALLDNAVENDESMATSLIVIAELIWVLESNYKLARKEAGDIVLKLLSMPILEVEDKNILMESIQLHSIRNIDFADAYNAVYMRKRGLKEIVSWLNRIEP